MRGQQRLDLRCEVEAAVVLREIEGLDAEAVAGQEELFALGVPDREGEDAVQPVEHRLTVARVDRQQHLGVAV